MNALRTAWFYFKYFLTNQVINRLPIPCLRLLWYREAMGIKIGARSQIWLGCKFYGDTIHQIEIGEDSVLSYEVELNASAPIKIGNHVQIASGVCILTADHDPESKDFRVRFTPVEIADHVWIATRAIVLQGVKIGQGGWVAAGSIVFQDVKPMTTVAGNPARAVGTHQSVSPSKPLDPSFPIFF